MENCRVQLALLYLQIDWKITLRVQKYGCFLLNCRKIPLVVLCWKCEQWAVWVDFKVEYLLESRRKKLKFYVELPSELADEKKWEQLQLTLKNSNLKRGKAIIRMKHKFIPGNNSLSYWMWFFVSFAQNAALRWR